MRKRLDNPLRFQRFYLTVKKHVERLSGRDIDMITELFCWFVVAEARETGSIWLPGLGMLRETERGSLWFTATRTCRDVVARKREPRLLVGRKKPSKTKLFHEWRHVFVGIKACLGLNMKMTYTLAKIFTHSIIMDLRANHGCVVGGLGEFVYNPNGRHAKFSFRQMSLLSPRVGRILRLAGYIIDQGDDPKNI